MSYRSGSTYVVHGNATGIRVMSRYSPWKENANVILEEDGRLDTGDFCYRNGWLGVRSLATGDIARGARVEILLVQNEFGTAITGMRVIEETPSAASHRR